MPGRRARGNLPGVTRRLICAATTLAFLAVPAGALATTPTITLSFDKQQIGEQQSAAMSFDIYNPNASALDVSFTDSMPSALQVAFPPSFSNTCDGSVSADSGSSAVGLSAESVPGQSLCNLTVEVTGVAAGDWQNSVTVNSNVGQGNTSQAALKVVPAAPFIATSFAPTVFFGGKQTRFIDTGQTTPLSFDLENLNGDTALNGVGFVETLPAGLVVASPNGVTGGCPSGAITAAPGGKTIKLSGAALTLAAPECDFAVNVTGAGDGIETASTGPVGSTEGGSGPGASATLSVFGPGPRVYFGNWDPAFGGVGWLSFAKLDGSVANYLATRSPGWFTGVAIDSRAGQVYFADEIDGHISHIGVDGTGVANVSAGSGPEGIAINPGGRLYWSEFAISNTGGDLRYENFGDSSVGTLDTTGGNIDGPLGVAVDPGTHRVYWTSHGTISYANLDGSGHGGTLNTTGATVSYPRGVAVDPLANRIYWADYDVNKISYANLDGTGGGHDLPIAGVAVNKPMGIAIDHAAGRIYWGDSGTGTIKYAQLDGTGGGTLATPNANPYGESTTMATYLALEEPPVASTAAAITGGTTPGSGLTCNVTWAADIPGSFLFRAPRTTGYQWTENGGNIAGATANTVTATTAGDYACRASATNVAGTTTATSAVRHVDKGDGGHTGATPPKITHARLAKTRFKAEQGTTLTFTLSAAADLKLTITGHAPGLRRHHACVAPTRRLRKAHAKRCSRKLAGATVTHTHLARGTDRVAFGGRGLKPGSYQLTLRASNAGGTSAPLPLSFRIVG